MQDENQNAADCSAVISLFFKALGHLPQDFLKGQIHGAKELFLKKEGQRGACLSSLPQEAVMGILWVASPFEDGTSVFILMTSLTCECVRAFSPCSSSSCLLIDHPSPSFFSPVGLCDIPTAHKPETSEKNIL